MNISEMYKYKCICLLYLLCFVFLFTGGLLFCLKQCFIPVYISMKCIYIYKYENNKKPTYTLWWSGSLPLVLSSSVLFQIDSWTQAYNHPNQHKEREKSVFYFFKLWECQPDYVAKFKWQSDANLHQGTIPYTRGDKIWPRVLSAVHI